MKSYATFFIVALMTLGLVFLLVTRERSKHDVPAEVLETKDSVGADGGADAAASDAGPRPMADAAAPKPAEKPLRIASLGWELIASGAAIAPVDGGAPVPGAPPIELAPETSLDAIEARLARGGSDSEGADIAVLPLPAFAWSFERLRALEPRAFLVVGFSRGREEVRATAPLTKPPPNVDEVKMAALTPASAADATARVMGSESATLLGLFALDLLGVAPSRLHLVTPGTPDAKAAPFAAVVKGAPDERRLALSTLDAARLIPFVAVASKSVIDGREAALREWSKAWLEGLLRASKDVPGIARRLAGKDVLPLAGSVGGAPEALVLVERLGLIDNASLGEQSSWIGPLARNAVTLETLCQRTWQLARSGGIIASAAPEPLPIDARIVAAIAPPPKSAPPAAAAGADAGAFAMVPTGAVPLVTYRAASGDGEKVATQIAFLAGVFERAVFKVSAKGGEKAARTIAALARDKGVAQARLATAASEPQAAFAIVEVVAPP